MHGLAQPASGMIPSWSPMDPGLDPLPFDASAAISSWTRPAGARLPRAECGRVEASSSASPCWSTRRTGRTRTSPPSFSSSCARWGRRWRSGRSSSRRCCVSIKARDYDAVISNWSLDTFKVDPTPLFSCAQARTEQSANRAGYCNPQADPLMQQGLRTTDQGEARRIWREFSELLQQDQPLSFLWWSEDLGGFGPRLQNVEADVRSKIVNIREWWIPTQMQGR